jgi:hypothetical protein
VFIGWWCGYDGVVMMVWSWFIAGSLVVVWALVPLAGSGSGSGSG